MAASRLPVSSSNPNPSLSRSLSRNQSFQRTPSRRVIFSEVPSPKHHSRNWESGHEDNNNIPEMPPKREARSWDEDNLSAKHQATDWESNEDSGERRGRRLCCAWASLIIGCLILALMLLGAFSLHFIKGALPEFRIKRLSITELEFSTKDKHTLLNADVQLLINATNNNDRYVLSYSTLTVEVSSEDINLGTTEVAAFKQNPKKVSELKLSTGVKKSVVDDAAADDLKPDYKDKEVVIDVVLKGSISLNMEGHELNGLPMKVLCTGIEQSEIDNGLQPHCRVKMFNFL